MRRQAPSAFALPAPKSLQIPPFSSMQMARENVKYRLQIDPRCQANGVRNCLGEIIVDRQPPK